MIQGDEMSTERLIDRISGYAIKACLFGICGTAALYLVSASYKSEHVPLTERLEAAYQTCQEIEDKSREVPFASNVYASCREVEDLYFKVKE